MTLVKMQKIVLHLTLAAIYVFTEYTCAKCPSSTLTIICAQNRLFVTGDSISIAEVIRKAPCWSDSGHIDIFALNKVIFDSDIDERDQNVNITVFSPTWEIIPINEGRFYIESRFIHFNNNTVFNFFGMSIVKINRGHLKFSTPRFFDENRIKIKFNNDPNYEESTLLKPTVLFIGNFNELQTLEAYVHYARENFETTSDLLHLWKFLVELNTQYKLNDLNGLIDEFLILEKKYFSLKNDIDFIPLYDSVRSQLEHSKGKQEKNDFDDLKNLLHAALISKILAIRNHTKVLSSSDDTFYGISTLKTDITHDYETIRNLDGNSEDRFHFYKSKILSQHEQIIIPRIKLTNELMKDIKATMDEIFDHNDLSGDDTINNENQLRAQLIRNQLVNPLKTIHLMLSFIMIQYPDTEQKTQLSSKVTENLKYKPRLFTELLKDFDMIQEENHHIFRYPCTQLKSMENYFKIQFDGMLLENTINRTENMVNVLFEEWPQLVDTVNSIECRKSTEQLYKMQGLMNCSEFGTEVYNICRNDSTKLMAFANQANDFQYELKKWKKYEKLMYKNAMFILEAAIQKPTGDQYRTGYDWYVPYLYELDYIFGQMKEIPIYSNDLERIIEYTRQAIKSTIELYQSNRVLKDRQTLRGLLSRIRDPIQNDDPEIQKKMEILNGITTTNIMLEICMTMAKEVLQLKMFPFYQKYSKLCELPVDTSSSDTEFIREKLLHYTYNLRDSVDDIKSQLNDEGAFVYANYTFNEKRPFYVWTYSDFESEITKLLNGEEIIIRADISTAPLHTRSHIVTKFRYVFLDFKLVNDTTRQNDLYQALDGRSVRMQTIGNHHYRCDKRIYCSPSITYPFDFVYTIDSYDGKMKYSNPSVMYSKMIGIGPILSPYTLWKIQLQGNKLRNEFQYKDLEINLLLVGEGQSIANQDVTQQICNNDELNKYYQLDLLGELK